MKSRFLLIVFSVFLLAWSGCKKDDDNNNSGKPTSETVTTTISGRIYDEAGNPLSGATVTAGSQSSSTNQWGIYLIENVDVTKGRALITVSKSGYWNQVGSCHPSQGT